LKFDVDKFSIKLGADFQSSNSLITVNSSIILIGPYAPSIAVEIISPELNSQEVSFRSVIFNGTWEAGDSVQGYVSGKHIFFYGNFLMSVGSQKIVGMGRYSLRTKFVTGISS
jgi:hypothetical protein